MNVSSGRTVLRRDVPTMAFQSQEKQDTSEGVAALEGRIDTLRDLHETADLLFRAFCVRRIGKSWPGELEQIRHWLKKEPTARSRAAS